jgi:glycine hydroxymethyltransferase
VRQVAEWIADILDAGGAESVVTKVRAEVAALCRRFPVYGE